MPTPSPAQAILASSAIRYDGALFDQLPKLRIVTRTGIGIDNVNLADATGAASSSATRPTAPPSPPPNTPWPCC
ncbi:MAG: hypothetical protein R2873_06515 [Caldilineaceae bacterium]